MRLEAIHELYPSIDLTSELENEDSLITNLSSIDWFKEKKFDVVKVSEFILQNKYLQDIPKDFPIFNERGLFKRQLVSQSDFQQHYTTILKKGRERLDFIFSHLVRFFQAAGFNGVYVLVDDFERIPDFQSARQKKDFALELRSCLFDGLYINARIGFYNFLLVLHAGVQRLISDAWAQSGMENRAPISPQTSSKHVIPFEKLSKDHASLLLKKYLAEYRIKQTSTDALFPFTEGAVSKIGGLSEYNAAKILKMAYDLLDKASKISNQTIIDGNFVMENIEVQENSMDKSIPTIENAESTDLLKKAKNQE